MAARIGVISSIALLASTCQAFMQAPVLPSGSTRVRAAGSVQVSGGVRTLSPDDSHSPHVYDVGAGECVASSAGTRAGYVPNDRIFSSHRMFTRPRNTPARPYAHSHLLCYTHSRPGGSDPNLCPGTSEYPPPLDQMAAGERALIIQNKGGGHGEIGYHLALNLAKEKGLKVRVPRGVAARARNVAVMRAFGGVDVLKVQRESRLLSICGCALAVCVLCAGDDPA